MCVHIVNYSSFIKRAITMLYSLSVDVFNERSTKSLYQRKLCIDPPPPPPFFFFPSSYPSTRGGGNDTFIELQPQPLSGRDQPLCVHPFSSLASIINFANESNSSSNTHRSLYPLITTKNRRIRESLIFLPK